MCTANNRTGPLPSDLILQKDGLDLMFSQLRANASHMSEASGEPQGVSRAHGEDVIEAVGRRWDGEHLLPVVDLDCCPGEIFLDLGSSEHRVPHDADLALHPRRWTPTGGHVRHWPRRDGVMPPVKAER